MGGYMLNILLYLWLSLFVVYNNIAFNSCDGNFLLPLGRDGQADRNKTKGKAKAEMVSLVN